jgi:Matrixin
MGQFGIRYATLLGTVMFLFVGFVACGSQMYKTTLTGDTGTKASAAGPDGAFMASSADGGGDPGSPNFGLHAPQGWGGSLPIHFKADYRMTPQQLQGLVKAMHTWETAVGRTLFAYDGPTAGVTGDTYGDLFSSLENDTNEHLLDDNWGKTGKSSLVLATTIWDNDPQNVQVILKSDMRFNNQYYTFGDAITLRSTDARTVVDIQTLATHELGHMLGLAHIPPSVDPDSIMVASIYIGEGLTSRQLSRGDVERIQKIYGCQGSSCDIDATLAKIDQQVAEPTTQSTESTAAVSH